MNNNRIRDEGRRAPEFSTGFIVHFVFPSAVHGEEHFIVCATFQCSHYFELGGSEQEESSNSHSKVNVRGIL